ncbi:DUF2087 domain-containing protein [Ornithinimicrobium sp. Arc0846-15]|uniref:DUF2087 domain-containing protein n=1 Tax=Ornithinimicrobium sp. INDO-MA30-4 TaxID=2908651 RepID=UPI001C683E61|nr:DUF2087 domain-containing protein [Ornithinimicrobium sp. INDO-MA30-4]MBW8171860.1 DUF2087 domain-containing protein [Ornithinimicrobium laminariae]UJH70660.1 DUF2087 domain-containing protein [Ornithinimicrobium sp. INDO-MA30-4]
MSERGPTPPIPPQLRPFVEEATGMLIQIPRREAKRAIALDWITAHLPAGATLNEKRMNEALAAVHDDTAAVRRYLVDSGRITRPEPGVYSIPNG